MVDLLSLQKQFILAHLREGDCAVDFTMGMTWGGDVVLKIRTKNLKGNKLDRDHNVSKWDYGRSFSYYGDIPISEIAETIIDKWHYL